MSIEPGRMEIDRWLGDDFWSALGEFQRADHEIEITKPSEAPHLYLFHSDRSRAAINVARAIARAVLRRGKAEGSR